MFRNSDSDDLAFDLSQIQALRQRTEMQNVLAWMVLVFVIAIIGTLLLLKSSETALLGREVARMQVALEELRVENERLEIQIGRGQMSDRLRREADAQGFTTAELDQVEFIAVPNFPSDAPDAVADESAQNALPTNMNDAIRIWLSDNLGGLVQGRAE